MRTKLDIHFVCERVIQREVHLPRERAIATNTQSSSMGTSGISNLSSWIVLVTTETGEGGGTSRKDKLIDRTRFLEKWLSRKNMQKQTIYIEHIHIFMCEDQRLHQIKLGKILCKSVLQCNWFDCVSILNQY